LIFLKKHRTLLNDPKTAKFPLFRGVAPLKWSAMTKLLMVCMGNTCRSPMAQAVACKLAVEAGLAQPFDVDCAGTHAHHLGERPDPRAELTLTRHGYEMGRVRSRRIAVQDFQAFDLILAMDVSNLTELRRLCPVEQRSMRQKFPIRITATRKGLSMYWRCARLERGACCGTAVNTQYY
jgi:protein-tyrosine-phosphatase